MEYKKSRWETKYDNYKKEKVEINTKMMAIRREQATLKEGPEYAIKKKELEELKRKQAELNKIEQNETKIEHIIEYKKKISEKNDVLLNAKKQIEARETKLNDVKAKIEAKYKQVDKLLAKLNSGKVKEEDKANLYSKIDEYTASINGLQANQQNLEEELQNNGKEKLELEIAKNDRLISKCNLIGASLLKGKNMEEIKAKLSNFEVAPNKDLADKKSKAEIEKFWDKYIDKNQEVEQKGPETPVVPENSTDPKAPETPEASETAEKQDNTPKKITIFDKLRNRFPRIAGFLDKATDKVKSIFKRREESSKDSIKDEVNNNTVEEIKEEIEKTTGEPAKEPETKEPETKEPEKKEKDMDSIENDMLLAITEKGEKGFRDSIRLDKKQLLENMRQAKAKEYAEKYGGRYETQDGADLDKQNDEGR